MVLHKASEKKPPIVLDIGNAFTKAGYSGDEVPICILPSKFMDVKEEKWLRDIHCQKELRCVLRKFLRHLYLKQLLVSMGERSVIICESLLCTDMWKQTLAQVLLLDFEVPSVVFAPRHLLALYTLGITSGLVVHSGFSETVVLPIYENMVLLNAWESLPVGGQAIEQNLQKLIKEAAQIERAGSRVAVLETEESLNQRQLEDIKVRTCFVTRHDRAKLIRSATLGQAELPASPTDIIYHLKGDAVLHIPGRVREMACEILYDYDNSEQTLAHLLLDSLVKCPMDTRRKLAANIVLIGGTTMLPGYKHRLQQELLELSQQPPYADKMSLKELSFHAAAVRENYAAWLGGALFGSSGRLDPYALTKSEFESLNETVPDWSNFSPEMDSAPHGIL